ncbi:DEAD/DEAH box helicase [Cytophagales bacterium LB-30]|uniref:DEAD/DEAH box helicase n=1 Tax=Shiella aurantiaca TaxID=3058365 RepID=A0ABT8F7K5_9BACT|nr:DEAD/DEAH box helicase [Shiella aurantiaca]MDN4166440.1 DEAD/DEAH box helicase [Shiella aurantiaca]
MKFSEYPLLPEIRESLEDLGFKRPTDIQFKAIPPILSGEDVLAIAQTGTGKTAAFVIPTLQILERKKNKQKSKSPQCIVLAPTHELALQILEVFKEIGKNTRLRFIALYGGVDQAPQIAQLQKGVDVVIATPGRMFDLISQGHLVVDEVSLLILDEADHMLDLGFLKDIQDLIRKIPAKRQTLFFSATIDEKIKKLAYSLVTRAIRIQISPKNPVAKRVHHGVAMVAMDDKRFFLERLVRENPEAKILVFVRTKVRAERVLTAMERVDIKAVTLHGDKEQNERTTNLNLFKSGECQLLIATDISARGIDIPHVHMVINYDMPDKGETYVHRVGRTGRGTQKGKAISLCSPEEKPFLELIEAYIDQNIQKLEVAPSEYAETIALSEETHTDWKSLMKKAAEEEANFTPKKKKKKK